MANSWLRLYHDMPNDPKFKTIARVSKQPIAVVLGVYVHLLVSASAAVDRGTLDGYNIEDLATALDVDPASVGAILDAMQGRVLDGDKVSGWNKRQVNREDGAAERAKAWRETKKLEAERNRTQPNATNGSRTQPNATERNRTPDKSREEEIREESTKTSSSSEKQDGAITPEMVTRSVLTELGLSGRDLAVVLDEVCRSQMKLYETPGALRDALIAAWREYDIAKPKLGYTKGATKFFGEGDWRNKEGWPWKPGESPPLRKPPGENKALQAIKEREEAVRRERGI